MTLYIRIEIVMVGKSHPGPVKLLCDLVKNFRLGDQWLLQNSSSHQFTWCEVYSNQVSLAKLDQFYVNTLFTLAEGEGIAFGSLFVCPHRIFVFFFSTACRIETKFSTLVQLLMQNVLMIIMTS